LFEDAATGRHRHSDGHLVSHTLAHAVQRRNFRRQDPHGLIVALELTANEDHRTGFDQTGRALVGIREHDDFHPAECVFEREHCHPVAFACLQLPARGDYPADAGVGLDGLPSTRAP